MKIPPLPTDVTSLCSFLATTTEPLYRLFKKEIQWKWGAEEQATFQALKNMLCADTVLVHFDPSLPVEVSCDASEVGLGAVLFHRNGDGSERPFQRRSQTHNVGIAKFKRKPWLLSLPSRNFTSFSIVNTSDHRPLIALLVQLKQLQHWLPTD